MDPKTLGDLVAIHAQIEKTLIETGGELTPEVEEKLTEFSQAAVLVPDRYHFVLKRLEEAEKQYDKRAQEWELAAKACSRAKAFLEDNLKSAMHSMGVKELKGEENRFLIVEGQPKLVITNEEAIPSAYKRVTQVVEIDKKQIKEDLLKGIKTDFAKLEPAFQLRKYLNKEK